MKVRLLGVAAVAAALVLPAAGVASAQPATDVDDGRAVGFVASDKPPVDDYWTRERMANARPVEIERVADPEEGDGDPVTGRKPVAFPPSAERVLAGRGPAGEALSDGGVAIQAALGVPKPYTSPPDRLNGKVFFTKVKSNGTTAGDWVCSGTSVNSPGLSLVWTAGHCVHGGPGYKAHKNWVFVPAYSSSYNGHEPYGRWYAKELWTWSSWVDDKNWSYDLGAVIVWKKDGRGLTQRIGGQGIWFNANQQQDYSSFGYPAAAPYTGWLQYRCNSGLTAVGNPSGPGPNTSRITCDMTGGSSGGGWLINMSSSGWGYVNSVNSYKVGGSPNTMYGPYHGAAGLTLYNHVKNKVG